MTISIDDLLGTHGIGTSGNQNAGRLVPKTARLIVNQPTAIVTIPQELAYSQGRDILTLYINQKVLSKDIDYSILSDEKTIQKKTGLFDAGTTLDFHLITNVKPDISTFDGSLLAEGSIVESKLAKEVRDKLESTSNMNTVYQDIAMLESKTRMMREVSANTQLLTEAGELVASGTTFGGNGPYEFGMKPDRKNARTNVVIPVGTTDLTGKLEIPAGFEGPINPYVFESGQHVTIFDDTNMEDVRIMQGSSSTLVITPTRNAYKLGAFIRRSTLLPLTTGKGYAFPTWNGTPLDKGTLRFNLGYTDEAILWATRNNDIQTRVKATYTPGDHPKDILGTTRAGTELIETARLGESPAVDLTKSDYYTTGSTILRRPAKGQNVIDFDIDSAKNVIVICDGTIGLPVIQKLDPNGNVLWENLELGKLTCVAVAPDDTIYVAYDLPIGQKLLRRFSASGVEIMSITRTAAHAKPIKISTCPNNDVVVGFSNTTGSSIRQYSGTGATLWAYEISGIVDMKVDSNGFVSVLKKGGDLYRFKPDGQLHWVTSTTLYGNESCLTVDYQGNTIVGYYSIKDMYTYFNKSITVDKNNPDRLLKKYNSNGTLVWEVHTSAGLKFQVKIPTVEDPGPESAKLLVADVEGNITVEMLRQHDGVYKSNIIKVDSNGKVIRVNQRKDRDRPCEKIIISKDGYTFFHDTPSKIGTGFFDSSSENSNHTISVSSRDFTQIFEQPEDMSLGPATHHAIDSKNEVYVVRRNPYILNEPDVVEGPSFLVKYDKDGRELWRKRYEYTVHQVCIDEFDHLYIATSGSESVIKMDTGGTKIWGKRYYNEAFAIGANPGGGCVVGYKYGAYQRLSKDGVVLMKRDTNLGLSFPYEGGTRHYQPLKIISDSKGRTRILSWPNRLTFLTETFAIDTSVVKYTVPKLPDGSTYYEDSFPSTPRLPMRCDITFDKEDNFYLVDGSMLIKNTPDFKEVWTTYIGMKRELDVGGYPNFRYQSVGVDHEFNVYASSSRGLSKVNKAGKVIGLYDVSPPKIEIDHAGDLYFPTYYYSKYGKFKRARSWTIVEDSKTWYIRSIKAAPVTLTIRIQSGDKVTSESVTIDAGQTYRYALLPEKFPEGLNIVRFSFDMDGYEEWQVTRTNESLAVTQFLTTNDTSAYLDLQLDVTRNPGSRSILHKYLGGIG